MSQSNNTAEKPISSRAGGQSSLPPLKTQHRWHALPAKKAVDAVQTDGKAGLSLQEVQVRQARFGANELAEVKARSLLSVFFHQFQSPLIYLLFAAALVALSLGHVNDALVIFGVVLLNAIIGAFQEGRAEQSLAALRVLAKHHARVVRAGEEVVVEAREVVPGDLLMLEAGDAVAADARLLNGSCLQIAEAALTGESVPVAKHLLPLAPDTPLADRRNMVYSGTHVTAGRACAVVIATGADTEIGRIATLAEAAEQSKTPLERRIARLGHYIIVASGVMFAVITLVGLWRGLSFGQIIMVGISQVVSMIPEGLPVAVTVALAVGVQRMARRGTVVRRLAAIETLGSTTVICSDKTGTLTRNEMTATAIFLADGRAYTVTGSGYEPVGEFTERGRAVAPAHADDLSALLQAAVLCNDAQLRGPGESPPRWTAIGDPTEVALVVLGIKGGILPRQLRERCPRLAEIPFDPTAQMMATQHQTPAGGYVVIKGAPEALLAMCCSVRREGRSVSLDEGARAAIESAIEGMAADALRVLAIGVVEGGDICGDAGFASFRNRITLLGLVGQIDPPRTEVRDAIARCRAAGIRPVMVTGDHKATGTAIAATLGISRPGDQALDGRELERLSDAELAARIGGVSVFARVHPAQKLRIVDAYQKRGEIVAMTGDGINDTPALVKANVGVAMGITGTEVAKESSEIVIGDDNFATIVAAVEEGRVVYRNIKKLILYLLSTSVSEVLVLLSALVLGFRPPLEAVQILWVNLVTDGAVTVALIMEPAEGDEMQQPPVPADESPLTRLLLTRMAFMVPAIAVSTLGWFSYRLSLDVPFRQVQTETFTVLAACQWFNVLNCRSETRSALNVTLLKNPWLVGGLLAGNVLHALVVFFEPLGQVFHTVPFSLKEVIAIGAVASLVLWVEELRKFAVRRRGAVAAEG